MHAAPSDQPAAGPAVSSCRWPRSSPTAPGSDSTGGGAPADRGGRLDPRPQRAQGRLRGAGPDHDHSTATRSRPASRACSPTCWSTQAGISSYDDLGASYKMSLSSRGFFASPVVGLPQGISVFLDGVRQNEPDAAQVNFDLLPMEHVTRVELLSGTASLLGRNSLGGAINLVTNQGGGPTRRRAGGLRAATTRPSGATVGRRAARAGDGGATTPAAATTARTAGGRTPARSSTTASSTWAA